MLFWVHFVLFSLVGTQTWVEGNQFNRSRRVDVVEEESNNSCDLFKGRWVYDPSYPLCDSAACPFISTEFDCVKNGRPDKQYLNYRWKPDDCDLPRFDGIDFLKRFQGKRIMFVGDSITFNQWQSFICMVHTAAPQAKYTSSPHGTISSFIFLEYNVSVMFDRNEFLVDMVKKENGVVLTLDSVENSAINWEGNDMLIFNTWHWWEHRGDKQPWAFIQDGDSMYKDMDRLVAFEKGLTTWGKWLDSKVDPNKTKVFYVGTSPTHSNGNDWDEANASCFNQSVPFNGSTYPGGPHPTESIVEKVLQKVSRPVTLLKTTALSQLRIDGHPSIYGSYKTPDCSHWCVGGVPDTWNQLLYTML